MKILLSKLLSCVVLVAFTLSCCFSGPAYASLNNYVQKYREIQITRKQFERLARYDSLISYFCSFSFFRPRHKVNPDFIKALILAESDGNPKARSHKDALGLTQIIYTTGKQAANELVKKNIRFRHVSKEKLKNLKAADLYNPAVNILLACYLIAKYNYQHKGKLDLVVSARGMPANIRSKTKGLHSTKKRSIISAKSTGISSIF